MLNEIVKVRNTITSYMLIDLNGAQRLLLHSERNPYRMKRETIRDCIFACDIEPSAVDITKLRLWLSLVIDNQIMNEENEELGYSTKPRELPNLDCNIICGNSLLDEFMGHKLITENDALKNASEGYQGTFDDQKFFRIINELIDLQTRLYDEKDHTEKESLKRQIQDKYDNIVLEQIGQNQQLADAYYQASQQPSRPFVLWQLYFPKVFRDNGGFDIVIGNPPYVDSEEMTKSMSELRDVYSKLYECAKGNWDLFVLFIERGINLLKENAVISFIVPNKLVSAPYTTAIRKLMQKNRVVEMRDYSEVNVFKTAAVYPVVFRLQMLRSNMPVCMDVMQDMEHISNHNLIDSEKFYENIDWDKYFHYSQTNIKIIDKLNSFKRLSEIAKVNGAATVNEAYLVKEFLFDGSPYDTDVKKFINTGGIDQYKSMHGESPIRYLKGAYTYPLVKNRDLQEMSLKRYTESNAEKIIIGGMTKILECYYDVGEYLAGKSTTIVYGCDHLKYIIAILNSKLMTYYYQTFFNSMSLAGGFYRIGAPQIKTLPIAFPNKDSIINTIEELVDTIIEAKRSCSDTAMIEKEIDTIVYKIYGLTDEEIGIVEKQMI